jgi:hypothetical protein
VVVELEVTVVVVGLDVVVEVEVLVLLLVEGSVVVAELVVAELVVVELVVVELVVVELVVVELVVVEVIPPLEPPPGLGAGWAQSSQKVLCFCGPWMKSSSKWKPWFGWAMSPAAAALPTRVASGTTAITWGSLAPAVTAQVPRYTCSPEPVGDAPRMLKVPEARVRLLPQMATSSQARLGSLPPPLGKGWPAVPMKESPLLAARTDVRPLQAETATPPRHRAMPAVRSRREGETLFMGSDLGFS